MYLMYFIYIIHLIYCIFFTHFITHDNMNNTRGPARNASRLVLLAPPMATPVVVCDEMNGEDAVHPVDKVDEIHQVHEVDLPHQMNKVDGVHQVHQRRMAPPFVSPWGRLLRNLASRVRRTNRRMVHRKCTSFYFPCRPLPKMDSFSRSSARGATPGASASRRRARLHLRPAPTAGSGSS